MISLRWLLVFIVCAANLSMGPGGIHQQDCAQGLPAGIELRFHPEGDLLVGDLVSLEVFIRTDDDLSNTKLVVSNDAMELGRTDLFLDGQGNYRAILHWFWDTRGLRPGEYVLSMRTSPFWKKWDAHVILLPPDTVSHVWKQVETDCCRIHTISNTRAEQDLPVIMPMLNRSANELRARMGADKIEKLDISLIPRIIGQGGFTTHEVYISYPERNYLKADFAQIIRHEMTHAYDVQLGGDLRPSLLVEGLAVYLSGGHYQREPLQTKTAALFDTGGYIPLEQLTDRFYASQHEISYLQAGALVEFMVDRWGWEDFSAFYRDIHPSDAGEYDAIDQALLRHFSISFKQLEDRFIQKLENQPENPDLRENVHLTVALYEAIRRFQQILDPSAYFREMWIPDGKVMRERGIVADYLRSPNSPAHLQIEQMLEEAGRNLNTGNHLKTAQLISKVHEALQYAESIACPAE